MDSLLGFGKGLYAGPQFANQGDCSWLCSYFSRRLTRITGIRNLLCSLPLALFQNEAISNLDFSQNRIRYLPPEDEMQNLNLDDEEEERDTFSDSTVWKCVNLRTLRMVNNQLVRIPKAIQGAVRLERLVLSNNQLVSFGQPWKCPLVSLNYCSLLSIYHFDFKT